MRQDRLVPAMRRKEERLAVKVIVVADEHLHAAHPTRWNAPSTSMTSRVETPSDVDWMRSPWWDGAPRSSVDAFAARLGQRFGQE